MTDRLPVRARLLYASSSLGSEALSQSRGLWLVYFYAPPDDAGREELLPLGLVGALLFAGRLLEGLDDAIVGWWSDRTSSRLGRRIPFVLLATPFWALLAVLVFTPPEAGTVGTAAWLFVTVELMFLFSTLSGGPYEALLPELARSSAERVRITGTKVYFGAAGGLVGLAGSGLLVDGPEFASMAIVMGVLALAFRYLGLYGVWRQALASRHAARIPLREAMKTTFANSSFRVFLPTFVLFQVALQLLLGTLPFYVNAVLGVEDEGTWVAILTAVAICVTLLVVPLFSRLARARSKRTAFSAAMLLASCSFPLLAVAGFLPGIPEEPQIIAFMALVGLPLAGVYLFPQALTADICDDDAVRTGMRREATYYGAQNVVEKLATSVTPLLLAGLLLLGDTADDPLGIRLAGPVAGLLVLAGFLVFRGYRLPDEVPAAW
jgi:glycoside/pentoside/hexuronide:cation symporter, GPH family